MGVKVKERDKGSGVWWVFIDHQGKRKAKKIGTDKRLALEVAKKIEARLTLGDLDLMKEDAPKVPTLTEYVNGWEDAAGGHPGWFKTVAVLSLKASTWKSYRSIIDYYLVPSFGNTPLNEITGRMLGELVYSLFSKGLRSGTVKTVKNCLSSILEEAKSDEYIQINPARGLKIKKPEDEQPKREPKPFTRKERDHFEEVIKQHFPKYYPLVLVGFRCGLRIGEIIGLQWQDINYFNGLLSVERNITRLKITTPKSKSSVRQVRMTKQLMEALKAHHKWAKEETLKRGWKNVPEWCFFGEDGQYLNYYNFIDRVWNRAISKAELDKRTPHDMRHSYATLRLSKGDSLPEVSKEMGHSSTEITYRTYYKWLPDESRSNINELDSGYSDATIRNLSATSTGDLPDKTSQVIEISGGGNRI